MKRRLIANAFLGLFLLSSCGKSNPINAIGQAVGTATSKALSKTFETVLDVALNDVLGCMLEVTGKKISRTIINSALHNVKNIQIDEQLALEIISKIQAESQISKINIEKIYEVIGHDLTTKLLDSIYMSHINLTDTEYNEIIRKLAYSIVLAAEENTTALAYQYEGSNEVIISLSQKPIEMVNLADCKELNLEHINLPEKYKKPSDIDEKYTCTKDIDDSIEIYFLRDGYFKVKIDHQESGVIEREGVGFKAVRGTKKKLIVEYKNEQDDFKFTLYSEKDSFITTEVKAVLKSKGEKTLRLKKRDCQKDK